MFGGEFMEISNKIIGDVIKKHFPERSISKIKDKGTMVKHNFKLYLDNGEIIYLKVKMHPEWGDIKHEEKVTEMLLQNNIPAPKVLAAEVSKKIMPYDYLIQEEVYGEKLSELLYKEDREDILNIYKAMGRYYRKLHSIKNHTSGLWSDDPEKILYPISPNDYMYDAEIINGSGKLLLESGRISENTYNRIVSIWKKNMEYLKDHTPTLINLSSFPWNIYLDKLEGTWAVVKLMALGDVIWWDPAFEIALIKYPVFYDIDEEMWQAFLKEYGSDIEEKRLLLYSIMQKLCAIAGVYMEPEVENKEQWISRSLKEIDKYLDVLER